MTTDPPGFTVNFETGQSFDLDAIRGRLSAFMPDNTHAWVITTVYAIEDPEQAMNDMSLDERNFVGVNPIHCLLCSEQYATVRRYHKCPQRPPESPGRSS